MPRINLLPWREELRQKVKKEFILAVFGAMLVGGLVSYGAKLTMQSWINAQNSRNALLRTEIAELDKQIEEINRLDSQKERLIARMEIIEQLQRSRPEEVHLIDELVGTLPEGVYLTEVKQEGNRIQIKGAAESSTRVSALMRNIDASQWLRDPGLDVVQTVETGPSRAAQFALFAQEVPMTNEGEEVTP
jgi:type IV pilus assembly protein PilN